MHSPAPASDQDGVANNVFACFAQKQKLSEGKLAVPSVFRTGSGTKNKGGAFKSVSNRDTPPAMGTINRASLPFDSPGFQRTIVLSSISGMKNCSGASSSHPIKYPKATVPLTCSGGNFATLLSAQNTITPDGKDRSKRGALAQVQNAIAALASSESHASIIQRLQNQQQ